MTEINHMQDHKASNKFQRIGVIPTTFPDHSAIKLNINKKKKERLKLTLNLTL